MKIMNFLTVVCFGFIVCVKLALSVTVIANDKLSVEFRDSTSHGVWGDCWQCFVLRSVDDPTFANPFEVDFDYFVEMNSTGGECCKAAFLGNCPPSAANCNSHWIGGFWQGSVNANQINSSYFKVDGQAQGGGGDNNCRPPLTSNRICPNYQFDYFFTGSSSKRVFPGGGVFPSDTLITVMKIANWSFASGSTGIRTTIVFTLPVDAKASDVSKIDSDTFLFHGVSGNDLEFFFHDWVVTDSTPNATKLLSKSSGPIDTARNFRVEFEIDLPPFSNNFNGFVQYAFGLKLKPFHPSTSEDVIVIGSKEIPLPNWQLALIIVLSVCCCIICICICSGVWFKMKRSKTSASKKMYGQNRLKYAKVRSARGGRMVRN